MNHRAETGLPARADVSEHPGIDFVDGPAGRRPRLAGTGLDIWEIIETVKDEGDSAEAAAAYLDIPVSSVGVATSYYAAHGEKIDDWTERVHRIADKGAKTP